MVQRILYSLLHSAQPQLHNHPRPKPPVRNLRVQTVASSPSLCGPLNHWGRSKSVWAHLNFEGLAVESQVNSHRQTTEMMYDKNPFYLFYKQVVSSLLQKNTFSGWSPKTTFESSSTRAPEFLHLLRAID